MAYLLESMSFDLQSLYFAELAAMQERLEYVPRSNEGVIDDRNVFLHLGRAYRGYVVKVVTRLRQIYGGKYPDGLECRAVALPPPSCTHIAYWMINDARLW